MERAAAVPIAVSTMSGFEVRTEIVRTLGHVCFRDVCFGQVCFDQVCFDHVCFDRVC